MIDLSATSTCLLSGLELELGRVIGHLSQGSGMSDTFLVGLISVSLLSVGLLYLSPSTNSPSPPPGGTPQRPPPPPYDDGSSNPFVSTFRALWRCVEVLGLGLTVLFVVGTTIFLYESLVHKLGRSNVEAPDEDWTDRDGRKRRKARLRNAQQHGLWPIVVLVVGLICSSFIDASVLMPAFFTSSSSGRYQSSSSGGSSIGFALLTIVAIVAGSVLLKRDFNLWRAGDRAGPTGATAKAAEAVAGRSKEGSTATEASGSEVRRRLPPRDARSRRSMEEIEMERLR